MKRDNLIGYAMLVMGFVAMAVVLTGLSALAADQPMENAIGPAMDSGKSAPDHGLSMQSIDPKTGELTKEMERPMGVPDAGTQSEPTDSKPFTGPTTNEISFANCTEGNDCVSF